MKQVRVACDVTGASTREMPSKDYAYESDLGKSAAAKLVSSIVALAPVAVKRRTTVVHT